MNANGASTFGASPPVFFVGKKFPNPQPFDVFEILDRAHAVFSPVPLIHMFHILTGETFTFKTKRDLPLLNHCAIFDFAPDNTNRFSLVE